ncbi:MAG: hypothetical protein J6Z36_00045 [Clostridia bacterium]|nr:hypothetical protein [Clostridia bacterium]
MGITKLDLMRLFESYDSEIDLGDFSPEELEELFDSLTEEPRPQTPAEFKRRYFEFYDDVKDKSLKKQDW